MFESIGAIAEQGPVSGDLQGGRAGKADRRTHQPVRRHSRPAGRAEGVFWKATSRAEVREIVLAARKYDRAGRVKGGRRPLGGVALEILDLMANLVRFKNGRLDPSIDYLMDQLGRSRAGIVRGLAALRDHGFLEWLRRYVPTGATGSRGPQVQQTSNAYRLRLPQKAVEWLGRFARAIPLPDDFTHTTEARRAENAAFEATLTPAEYALHHCDDPALGAALASLFKGLQLKRERESKNQSESLSSF